MSKDEIEKEYRIVNGIIVSPGKFEACPVYAPYFWNLFLDGGGDHVFAGEGDGGITWFEIDESDIDAFPELSGWRRVGVWEDGNGFIYCAHETTSRSQFKS